MAAFVLAVIVVCLGVTWLALQQVGYVVAFGFFLVLTQSDFFIPRRYELRSSELRECVLGQWTGYPLKQFREVRQSGRMLVLLRLPGQTGFVGQLRSRKVLMPSDQVLAKEIVDEISHRLHG